MLKAYRADIKRSWSPSIVGRVRIVQVTTIALGGAIAVAAFSLWQAAERLGGTVEWLSARQPKASPQPSATHANAPAAPGMQRDGNAAANASSATSGVSGVSGVSSVDLLDRLEQANAAAAFADPELEATLRVLLVDPDPEVRQGAAELLEFWLRQSPETVPTH